MTTTTTAIDIPAIEETVRIANPSARRFDLNVRSEARTDAAARIGAARWVLVRSELPTTVRWAGEGNKAYGKGSFVEWSIGIETDDELLNDLFYTGLGGFPGKFRSRKAAMAEVPTVVQSFFEAVAVELEEEARCA